MPNPLVVGAGASVFSGLSQSSAAKRAGGAQQQASNDQIAETRRQFDFVRKLLQPYVKSGYSALQGQLDLLGIGGTPTSGGDLPTITPIMAPGGGRSGGFDRNDPIKNPFGFGGGPSGSGGIAGYTVNGRTFGTLAQAQKFAEKNRTPVVQGTDANTAQAAAIERIKSGSQFEELAQQGEYGILSNASATGGLRGGNTQGVLAQYRPAMLQMLIDKQLANLGGIAASGQNAAAGVGTAATNAGRDIGISIGERGAAAAGGALGRAEGVNTMLSGITGALGQFSGQSGGMPAGASLFSRWGF